VEFDPLAAGLRTAQLQVTDADGVIHSVPLQGFTYGGTTRMVVSSDPGSGLGDGDSYTYSPAGDTIWAIGTPQEFQFAAADGNGGWDGTFEPPAGEQLTAGSSWALGETENETTAHADIGWKDHGCSTESGSLQVLSATYNSFGDMTSFAVKFAVQCTDEPGAVHGEFDWRANDDVAPAPWMAADATGAPPSGSESGGATPPANPVAPTAPATPASPASPPTPATSTTPAVAVTPPSHATDSDVATGRLKALVTTLSRTTRRTSRITHLNRHQINSGSLRRARRSVVTLESELTAVKRAVSALSKSRRAQAARILRQIGAWQTTLSAEQRLLTSRRANAIAGPLVALVSRANDEASSAIRALGRLVN
jgi:hypothetical protein